MRIIDLAASATDPDALRSEFWGSEHADRIEHDTLDDAVESILDDSGETDGEVIVQGYVPMDPAGLLDRRRIVEHALETLDEEYGDPEGDPTEPSEAMLAAAEAFSAAVEGEYRSWACEAVIAVRVPVAEWIAKEHPEWLDDEVDDEREVSGAE